jgi:hypothetical protein
MTFFAVCWQWFAEIKRELCNNQLQNLHFSLVAANPIDASFNRVKSGNGKTISLQYVGATFLCSVCLTMYLGSSGVSLCPLYGGHQRTTSSPSSP